MNKIGEKWRNTITIVLGLFILVTVIVSLIQIIKSVIELGFWYTFFGLFLSLMIGGGVIGITRKLIMGEIWYLKHKETLIEIGGFLGIIIYVIYVSFKIGWFW